MENRKVTRMFSAQLLHRVPPKDATFEIGDRLVLCRYENAYTVFARASVADSGDRYVINSERFLEVTEDEITTRWPLASH